MKNALMRSLALPECTAKHNKIQALTGKLRKELGIVDKEKWVY